MRAVFDTNILIDYLNGRAEAEAELARYQERLISRITWMEVLVGAESDGERDAALSFLALFRVVELSAEIAGASVVLRKERRLRLPDAIVLATAQTEGCLLITRNTRDFRADWVEVRVPYRLD